jgi:hypothetical protein
VLRAIVRAMASYYDQLARVCEDNSYSLMYLQTAARLADGLVHETAGGAASGTDDQDAVNAQLDADAQVFAGLAAMPRVALGDVAAAAPAAVSAAVAAAAAAAWSADDEGVEQAPEEAAPSRPKKKAAPKVPRDPDAGAARKEAAPSPAAAKPTLSKTALSKKHRSEKPVEAAAAAAPTSSKKRPAK